ncbi:serine threonine- kinase DCLK1-like isoform X3 [Paramuricea clavata]|uniref:Serine threonine- kinase DCLK1-like isoform X3 n=1 Tax=Paramuricea clavata TaxID=317549 RepID=A0A6S7G668_PARCT|nr:serine threonine- kinase DCLK1-like isoform X3 [Paramuricea clavata]
MIGDLVSALSYLHDLSVIHRDIKPENLLVVYSPNGVMSLKVADFGLATEVHEPQFLVCGTPTYVAPEILDESGYELKADVWAAGVITYILLCGFPPFRSNDQEELFDMILSGDYEFLSPFWDNISQSAKDLISRMLLINPNERYSARDSLNHPWIQGHTAKDTNLQSTFASEVNKNFQSKKKHRAVTAKPQTSSELCEANTVEYEVEESDDEPNAVMPVIEEDNELRTDQVQFRHTPLATTGKRKPRPKSLDFHMMGRHNEDYSQPDYELTQRNLREEFNDEDEYY